MHASYCTCKCCLLRLSVIYGPSTCTCCQLSTRCMFQGAYANGTEHIPLALQPMFPSLGCHGTDVVLFMGMCIDPPSVVSEWCSRGPLHSILAKALEQPVLAAQLSWHRRLFMALDAAKVCAQAALADCALSLRRLTPSPGHICCALQNRVVRSTPILDVTDFKLNSSRMVLITLIIEISKGTGGIPLSAVCKHMAWEVCRACSSCTSTAPK